MCGCLDIDRFQTIVSSLVPRGTSSSLFFFSRIVLQQRLWNVAPSLLVEMYQAMHRFHGARLFGFAIVPWPTPDVKLADVKKKCAKGTRQTVTPAIDQEQHRSQVVKCPNQNNALLACRRGHCTPQGASEPA